MVGHSLEVLYEDEALLIVEKPAGLHTAPLVEGEPDTLLALVLGAFPEISSVPGMKPSEPGLLHRLDRDTSGVVVIARTRAAFASLRLQFASGQVRKEYHAACACRADSLPLRDISIRSLFAPAGPGGRKVRVVMPEEKSARLLRRTAPALYRTEVRLEKVHEGRALVEAVIQKGFRHQVRAHLAFTGLPIFGDPLYGVPVPPGAPQRMYLHASAVLLAHPVTGDELRITSPLPQAFSAVL